jgi:protein-disulfide isomerase
MNEKLFASVDQWGAEGEDPAISFKTYAQELGLDAGAFGQCLDAGETAMIVQGDLLAGESLGVNATPYFFINDLPIRGRLPIDSLGRIIEYLAAGGEPPEILPQGDDGRTLGNRRTAKAIVVAFVDYASPDSARHALDVLPQLKETYVDLGQLYYILHPWATERDSASAWGGEAAECAGQQGKYWEMHDRLFKEQAVWTVATKPQPLLVGYAEDLGLDTDEFAACLASDWAWLQVQGGTVVGARYGVPGAPIFLFNNGQGQQGSPSIGEFQMTIDSILERQ